MVTCDFCWRYCRIREGERGVCGIRENRNGKAITVNYGRVLSAAVDPIEKKPFYHLRPGAKTLSIALFGCNLQCRFCQNHDISQKDSPLFPAPWKDERLPYTAPRELVRRMEECGVSIMAYTYSDPIVWQDYMLDTARLVEEAGGINCMVTNGSLSREARDRIIPVIDAFNVDVKGDDDFYRKYCGGRLTPVLETLQEIVDKHRLLEVTTLVIEELHEIEDIVWIGRKLEEIGVQVWHLSRFFPHYKMSHSDPTTESFLEKVLEEVSKLSIPFIYAGNSGSSRYSRTYCPSCGEELIGRRGYFVHPDKDVRSHILMGRCQHCGAPVYGLFD